ncbi:MAG: hypothetical protein AAF909_07180 [Pseudomonadota bacterium]
MPPGIAPSWVDTWLPLLLGAAALAGAAWLVLVLLDYFNRRAYNLTMADRGGSGATPDFLKVDAEKREAAREAGEVLDEKIAERERAAAEAAAAAAAGGVSETAARVAPLARLTTAAFALLTVGVTAVGALGRIEFYDEGARRFSNWERLVELVSTYWVGFAVVACLVLIQVYHAVRAMRRA